jgi:hypothetical protein
MTDVCNRYLLRTKVQINTREPIRIPSKCHKRDDTSLRLEGGTDEIRQGQTDNEGIRGIHKYPQIHVHYT